MTRHERAAEREKRLREKLAEDKRALRQVQAHQRADARAARNKRRFLIGQLADAAGLFTWDDATLQGLFQGLAFLRDTPAPVAVLTSLLADPGSPDAEAVPGRAPPWRAGAAPAGAGGAVAR